MAFREFAIPLDEYKAMKTKAKKDPESLHTPTFYLEMPTDYLVDPNLTHQQRDEVRRTVKVTYNSINPGPYANLKTFDTKKEAAAAAAVGALSKTEDIGVNQMGMALSLRSGGARWAGYSGNVPPEGSKYSYQAGQTIPYEFEATATSLMKRTIKIPRTGTGVIGPGGAPIEAQTIEVTQPGIKVQPITRELTIGLLLAFTIVAGVILAGIAFVISAISKMFSTKTVPIEKTELAGGGEMVCAGNKCYMITNEGEIEDESRVGLFGSLFDAIPWIVGGGIVIIVGRTIYIHKTGKTPPGEVVARKAAQATVRAGKKTVAVGKKAAEVGVKAGKKGVEKTKAAAKFIKEA